MTPTKPIILDTGCSRKNNGFRDEFVEGILVPLYHPHPMDVIGASSEATHWVTLHYEYIHHEGTVSILEGTGLFILKLKCRLLIPQEQFMKLQRLKKPEGSFTMTWDKYVLKLSCKVNITIY